MEENAPWKNLGTIGLRLVDLVIRYAVTFTITWSAASASVSFSLMSGLPAALLVFGAPSVLLSFVYGLASPRTGMEFRGRLAGLLFLPVCWLIFFFPILPILVMGQSVFALVVMRVPFVGPSRLRRSARTALAWLHRRGAASAGA
ncbi:hypothetical protein AB0F18_10840 [Streptomyces sp. NPDC029216]|uniref:hypothetical protein n=1 Tax=Streptomyces sp. NPDC029216 TaxID=3154701 RepID=UPI00340869D4